MDDPEAPNGGDGPLAPNQGDSSDAESRTPSDANGVTVGTALRATERCLESAGIDGARFEATLLLGHVLGHTRAQLLAALSDPISDAQSAQLAELADRRARREPLQYLRGSAPFLDFELDVAPGVLIPRPETEALVKRALELWDPTEGRWAVDVGTGSGAIAIGLARQQPQGWVLAVDQSLTALDMTARNAEKLGVRARVALVRGNFLRALELSPDDIGVIVSNPPYVADGDEVDDEVRYHEPREAWAAGPTGLEAYQRIIPEAAALLRPGRCLLLELGYGQEDAVCALLADVGGWDDPTVDADHRGIRRVLAVRRARDS